MHRMFKFWLIISFLFAAVLHRNIEFEGLSINVVVAARLKEGWILTEIITFLRNILFVIVFTTKQQFQSV